MSALAVFSIAYGLAGLVALRPLAGHLAWRMVKMDQQSNRNYGLSERYDKVEPSGDYWTGAYFSALLLVIVWPALLVVLVAGRAGPTIGAEREAQFARREKRLREMERELGIGDGS